MEQNICAEEHSLAKNFLSEYYQNKRMVHELKKHIMDAQKRGGILTTSLDALQDSEVDIHVGPEVIMPYLEAKLSALNSSIETAERKMKQIAEIINN